MATVNGTAQLYCLAQLAVEGRHERLGLLRSPRGRAMLSYFPEYYRGAAIARLLVSAADSQQAPLEAELEAELARTPRVLSSLLNAWGVEFDQLRAATSSLLDQAYVQTATWGLDTWEELLGLGSDSSLSEEQRRARIIAKLRGLGIINAYRLLGTALAYELGEAVVIEDFPNYTVSIRFTSPDAGSNQFVSLEPLFRELVPAHLALRFEYVSETTIVAGVTVLASGDISASGPGLPLPMTGRAQVFSTGRVRVYSAIPTVLTGSASLTASATTAPVSAQTITTTFAG